MEHVSVGWPVIEPGSKSVMYPVQSPANYLCSSSMYNTELPRPKSPQIDDLPLLQYILSTSHSSHFSKMAILKTDTLPSHLHSLRRLALNDHSALHLQVSPPPSVPLLRQERTELETEALSLRILADAGLPVPAVIRHDKDASLLGAPFLLTTSLPGVPLGHILPSASRAERRALDSQIDSLEARLNQLASSTFGPVTIVAKGEGFQSWPDAFEYMITLALKDGEDMYVNLPYAQIRDAIRLRVARDALSEIKSARLCVGGLGGPAGVLVEGTKVVGLVGFKCVWWGDGALEVGGFDADDQLRDSRDLVKQTGVVARALL
jgi:hypothetical protein